MLHRPPETGLPPPPSALSLPVVGERDRSAFQDEALAARPELQAKLAQIEARKAELRLRGKDFYPDFEAMTSFNSMWGDSKHRWMVGVGVNLPIRRERVRAAVAAAESALRRAESERVALEDMIRTEAYTAHERLLEARHVVELFRSRLLPASRDQIRSARAGFETGQNSFLALIEAERNQRNIELGYEEALTDFFRRRAELDRALGRAPDIFGTNAGSCGTREDETGATALDGV